MMFPIISRTSTSIHFYLFVARLTNQLLSQGTRWLRSHLNATWLRQLKVVCDIISCMLKQLTYVI